MCFFNELYSFSNIFNFSLSESDGSKIDLRSFLCSTIFEYASLFLIFIIIPEVLPSLLIINSLKIGLSINSCSISAKTNPSDFNVNCFVARSVNV